MDFIDLLKHLGPWISQGGFLICLIPQIIKNYRFKTTQVLSFWFLASYTNGYAALLFYFYCLNFPFGYKVVGLLQVVAVLMIVFQRLYYDRQHNKKYYTFFITNILVVIVALFLAVPFPKQVGYVSGWVFFALFTFSPIPQIIRFYRIKRVEGFSFLFSFIIVLCSVQEIINYVVFSLPIQTLLTSLKSIFLYLFLCLQVWLYKE